MVDAEYLPISRMVERHFTALAQKSKPESYGVSHDSKVVVLLVKIRKQMKVCTMIIRAIRRCIRYRVRALEGFTRVEEYSILFNYYGSSSIC